MALANHCDAFLVAAAAAGDADGAKRALDIMSHHGQHVGYVARNSMVAALSGAGRLQVVYPNRRSL